MFNLKMLLKPEQVIPVNASDVHFLCCSAGTGPVWS